MTALKNFGNTEICIANEREEMGVGEIIWKWNSYWK